MKIATLFATFSLALPVLAQEPATLEGRVVDQTGGVLVGAGIRLSGEPLAAARTAVTDPRGEFQFEGVPPGTYRLTVRAAGFRAKTLTLESGELSFLRIEVEPLGLSEEITVAATATRYEIDRVPSEVNVIERESFDRVLARSLDDEEE